MSVHTGFQRGCLQWDSQGPCVRCPVRDQHHSLCLWSNRQRQDIHHGVYSGGHGCGQMVSMSRMACHACLRQCTGYNDTAKSFLMYRRQGHEQTRILLPAVTVYGSRQGLPGAPLWCRVSCMVAWQSSPSSHLLLWLRSLPTSVPGRRLGPPLIQVSWCSHSCASSRCSSTTSMITAGKVDSQPWCAGRHNCCLLIMTNRLMNARVILDHYPDWSSTCFMSC
jgi:hypothetical protein